MNKKFVILLLILVVITCYMPAFCITATGQYNSGKRAFLLGHWQEANEVFTKFLKIWPTHLLALRASYFKAITELRLEKSYNNRKHADKLIKLTRLLVKIKNNLPDFDTSELEVYLQGEKSTHWKENAILALSERQLMHFLTRKYYDDPQKFPIKTLNWIANWKKTHNSIVKPELDAKIAYIKALSLWQILLSPLSKSANATILKAWGCWPVHTAFEEALDTGFSKGSPSQKRDVALLGFHYECFLHNSILNIANSVKNNRWYSYLKTRGISDKEAWCPR